MQFQILIDTDPERMPDLPAAEFDRAHAFPWSRFGSIEVRPVRDMQAVRMRVGAP